MSNSRWLALFGVVIYGTTVGVLILHRSLRAFPRNWTKLGIGVGTMGYSYLAAGLLVIAGPGLPARVPETLPLVLGVSFLILVCYWPWVSLVGDLRRLADKRRAILLGFLVVAVPGITIGIFSILVGGLGISNVKVSTVTMVLLLSLLALLHLVDPKMVLGLNIAPKAASRDRVFLWVVPLVLPSAGAAAAFGEYFVAVFLVMAPASQGLYAVRAVRAIHAASQASLRVSGG